MTREGLNKEVCPRTTPHLERQDAPLGHMTSLMHAGDLVKSPKRETSLCQFGPTGRPGPLAGVDLIFGEAGRLLLHWLWLVDDELSPSSQTCTTFAN